MLLSEAVAQIVWPLTPGRPERTLGDGRLNSRNNAHCRRSLIQQKRIQRGESERQPIENRYSPFVQLVTVEDNGALRMEA